MKTTETNHLAQDEKTQLKERVAVLEQQLDWFKRQLFGRKSEKQLLEDDSTQGSLFATDKKDTSVGASTEIKAHTRKSNKQLNGDEVNETGLRFDASVPTKVIEIQAPELQGDNANDYEIIGDKDEIAFTWSNSRGFLHAKNQLEGFADTLLTDGYTAYSKTVTKLNEKEETITHATCWVHARRYFDRAILIEQ